MVGHFPTLVLFCIFLAVPSFAFATDEDEACPEGKFRNISTEGHCCWEGQSWDADLHDCVGMAECPPGFLPSEAGTNCAEEKCLDGRVPVGGGCCWPGQEFKESQGPDGDKGQCVGLPQCPSGWQSTGFDCRRLKPLPPGELRNYEGIKSGDYVPVREGDYLRGSPRSEPGRFKNERQHATFLTRPFMLKRTEVTQHEWLQLVPHNPSRFRGCGDECPVERVSWYEALTWLNRLSEKEGLSACYELSGCKGSLGGGCRLGAGNPLSCAGDYVCSVVKWKGLDCNGYRLPTEAEWEYAARAGSLKATYVGTTIQTTRLKATAWYGANSAVTYPDGVKCDEWAKDRGEQTLCGSHPTGSKTASPWGHHDLHGNVMEWVWDAFHRYPKKTVVDPIRHVGMDRVVRGGSWASDARGLRVAQRGRLAPGARNAMLGFRAARTITSTTVSTRQSPKPEASERETSDPSSQTSPASSDDDVGILMEQRPPRPPPSKEPYAPLNAETKASPGRELDGVEPKKDNHGGRLSIPPGQRIRVEKRSAKEGGRSPKQSKAKKTKRTSSERKDGGDSEMPRRTIPLKVIPIN